MSGSDLCIPRNETAQPRYFQNRIKYPVSQFPHTCICERFILYIPRIGLPILLQANRQTDPGNIQSPLFAWSQLDISDSVSAVSELKVINLTIVVFLSCYVDLEFLSS